MSGSGKASILLYHGVGECPSPDRPHNCVCMPRDVFAAQMAFLGRHRRVVSLASIVQGTPSPARGTVAITFDDGYRNFLTDALPILRSHGFPATVFVTTRWTGQLNGWMEGMDCFPLATMSAEELIEAERHGASIESHGHGHLDLPGITRSEARADLEMSVAELTRLLGRPPRYVAYPFGRHSAAVADLVAEAGFEAAFLAFDRGAETYARARINMDGHEGRFRLRLKTSGDYMAWRRSRLGAVAAGVIHRAVRRPVHG